MLKSRQQQINYSDHQNTVPTLIPQLNTDEGEPLEPVPLLGLVALFARVGIIGFGGGMATIALMEEEFVRRRRLISLEDFIHGVGLGHMLGGFALNVAVFIGYRRFGMVGALLSSLAFLAPSFLLTIVLSDLYFRYHAIPSLQSVIAGLSPVVIGLILNAAWSIRRRALHSRFAIAIAAAALAAGLNRVNAALILLAAGASSLLLPLRARPSVRPGMDAKETLRKESARPLVLLVPFIPASLTSIFVIFVKTGLLFFGGGFVLVPILHSRLVTELGWLTPSEFLDGLAISNLTPGPIALIAAFAGFRLHGISGAFVATVGLFAPGVLLMLAISRQYHRFASNYRAEQFLAGVDAAVVGLIVNAAVLLSRNALVSWQAYAFLMLSFVLLARLRWHPIFVLSIGAVVGVFRQI